MASSSNRTYPHLGTLRVATGDAAIPQHLSNSFSPRRHSRARRESTGTLLAVIPAQAGIPQHPVPVRIFPKNFPKPGPSSGQCASNVHPKNIIG